MKYRITAHYPDGKKRDLAHDGKDPRYTRGTLVKFDNVEQAGLKIAAMFAMGWPVEQRVAFSVEYL